MPRNVKNRPSMTSKLKIKYSIFHIVFSESSPAVLIVRFQMSACSLEGSVKRNQGAVCSQGDSWFLTLDVRIGETHNITHVITV